MIIPEGPCAKQRQKDLLRSKLRSGAQLQACANEFSDIDQIGLATRIADLEEEEELLWEVLMS